MKKDYEQLYYELAFKNRKLIYENRQLKQEIEMLKKYQNQGDIKDIIIKEIF